MSKAHDMTEDLREAMFGEKARRAALQEVDEQVRTSSTSIQASAAEFGLHIKSGGWRLGFLVAKSVEPQQGERTDLSNNGEVAKVNQTAFRNLAGLNSTTSIANYLAGWEEGFKRGLVPSASTLTPEDEYEFDPQVHTEAAWKACFNVKKDSKQRTVDDELASIVNFLKKVDPKELVATRRFAGQSDFCPQDVYSKVAWINRRTCELMGFMGGDEFVVGLGLHLKDEVGGPCVDTCPSCKAELKEK